MPALRDVLGRIASGAISIHVAPTEIPSPFAASLQFGFVIDHMYGDDTPRAEQRAALLSLDRVLLDELMGGEGADDATLAVLHDLLARRRGTAHGRQARDAEELAVLLDRAGDLTRAELAARVAPSTEWRRGDPLATLLDGGRLVAARIPTPSGPQDRWILMDDVARYVAAFGADVVPDATAEPVLTERAARREVLSRFVALAGPVSVDDVRARYDFDPRWVERRLTEWEQKQVLVRGVFGGDRSTTRWCSRRLLEQARRRELAQARKQIEAVSLAAFQRFEQRWQHLTPDTRTSGHDGTASVMQQLYGLARAGDAWERDYLPARIEGYDPGEQVTVSVHHDAALIRSLSHPGLDASATGTVGDDGIFEVNHVGATCWSGCGRSYQRRSFETEVNEAGFPSTRRPGA